MEIQRFTLVTSVVRKGDGQGRVNFEVVREARRQGIEVVLVASEIAPELQGDPGVTWVPVNAKGFPTYLLRELVFFGAVDHRLENVQTGPVALQRMHHQGACRRQCLSFRPFLLVGFAGASEQAARGLSGAYHRLYSTLNAKFERRAYRLAKKVVSVSEQVRSELAAIGIDPAKILTVPNGVDTDEFQPGPADRAHFGLPQGVPLALFAGDLRSPRKNLDTVLGAMREVPQLHLAVAGWLETSPYPAMSVAMGISDRVHFLGNVREMPLLMRSCDVFAFPSRYEACSLVMLEAMAAGLPVVTSQTTGGSELVPRDGGFLMRNPDDQAGLVEILRTVVSDGSGLAEMSRKSRAKALTLRWDEMARSYLRILEAI